jgi:hypothetical protein
MRVGVRQSPPVAGGPGDSGWQHLFQRGGVGVSVVRGDQTQQTKLFILFVYAVLPAAFVQSSKSLFSRPNIAAPQLLP